MTVEDLPTEQRQALAVALKTERARLAHLVEMLAEAGRSLGESQGDEGDISGSADLATDLAEEELDLALERSERARLKEVEAALRRLANGTNGTYGTCEVCARPIGFARLQALPWTRHCRVCAEAVPVTSPGGMSRPTASASHLSWNE